MYCMIDIFAICTQYVHPSLPRNASRTTTDSGRVGKVTSTWSFVEYLIFRGVSSYKLLFKVRT
jgi:hypothetical protein